MVAYSDLYRLDIQHQLHRQLARSDRELWR